MFCLYFISVYLSQDFMMIFIFVHPENFSALSWFSVINSEMKIQVYVAQIAFLFGVKH